MKTDLGLIVLASALFACGGGGDDFAARTCTPGVTQECACPGGAKGAQACASDGNGYEPCQCSSGSGGSAGAGGNGQSGSGGGATGGSAGSGGAGGSCTPRTMCPAPPEDGGTQLCGMLDDYCGGKLSCGCEFGECVGGACACSRLTQWDQTCLSSSRGPFAMQCAHGTSAPPQGCVISPPGRGMPAYSFCCQR